MKNGRRERRLLLRQRPLSRSMTRDRLVRPTASRGITSRSGAAAVEFAIVAPVFLIMVLGIIELGRALMVQQVMINTSRVGARHAVTLSATSQSSIDAAEDYAESVGISSASITITPDPAVADPGDEITVVANVDFSSVSWLPTPWIMGGKVLTATSIMRKEGF